MHLINHQIWIFRSIEQSECRNFKDGCFLSWSPFDDTLQISLRIHARKYADGCLTIRSSGPKFWPRLNDVHKKKIYDFKVHISFTRSQVWFISWANFWMAFAVLPNLCLNHISTWVSSGPSSTRIGPVHHCCPDPDQYRCSPMSAIVDGTWT